MEVSERVCVCVYTCVCVGGGGEAVKAWDSSLNSLK